MEARANFYALHFLVRLTDNNNNADLAAVSSLACCCFNARFNNNNKDGVCYQFYRYLSY